MSLPRSKNKSRPGLTDILRPDTTEAFRKLNPGLLAAIAAPRSPASDSEPGKGPKTAKTKKKSQGELCMEAWLTRQVKEHQIHSFEFEALRLMVGTDRCEYKPDFLVRRHEDKPLIIEVKGEQKWEDSIVKFKAAKLTWGWLFDFECWEYAQGWRQIY